MTMSVKPVNLINQKVQVNTPYQPIQNPVNNRNTNSNKNFTIDSLKVLKPDFYKKYIIQLQGKEFITYNGLMILGKEKGINKISTTIVQAPNSSNNFTCIIHASIEGYEETENGEKVLVSYDGIGDANASNCNKNVAKHSIRMAETRAKARALRDFVGIDVCSQEELGGDGKPYMEVDIKNTKMTQEQILQITELKKNLGWDSDTTKHFSIDKCGNGDLASFTYGMAEILIHEMQNTLKNLQL